MPRRKLLCVRPDYETATHVMSVYYKQFILDTAPSFNVDVIDLWKDRSDQKTFREMLDRGDPILVCGVGHGSETKWTGWYGSTLLERGNWFDGERMKGRVGSFLSCKFGQSAPWFVEQGMRAFMGYADLFIFAVSGPDDGAARPFAESHMTFEFELLRGKSVKEAYDAQTEMYNKYIATADPFSVRYLIHDRDCRILEGDWEFRPFPAAPPPPPPPKYQCPKCDFATDDPDEFIAHVCGAHCPKPEPPKPCWLPKFIRKWLGCPLDQ